MRKRRVSASEEVTSSCTNSSRTTTGNNPVIPSRILIDIYMPVSIVEIWTRILSSLTDPLLASLKGHCRNPLSAVRSTLRHKAIMPLTTLEMVRPDGERTLST